jgi:hypothetical protein
MMPDASKLDILSAPRPPPPPILTLLTVQQHTVPLKLCTVMNVKTGGWI